jgi:hypothetical protein
MWPVVAMSLATCASLSAANYDDAQLRNLENRVCTLEQRKGACGMINPSARPYVKCGADVFITADLLVWQANANGLGFAIENQGSTTVLNDGRIKDPKFDWDVGFRVGLGYNMPHDGWDIYADWTSFHTHARNSQSAPVGGSLLAVWNNPNLGGVAFDSNIQDAKANWRLRLNMVDLELGREFFVSKWMTLRPHMGLRTAWVRQKYNVRYLNSNFFGFAGTASDTVKMKNRYWGLGIRSGLDTQWGLGCGWSIYGDAALSLLRGNFRVDEKETVSVTSTLSPKLRDRFQATRAMADLAMGLRWDQLFGDDEYRLAIQAGWEHHLFFGQNQLKNFVSDSFEGKYTENNGDLGLSGFTLEVRFDF